MRKTYTHKKTILIIGIMITISIILYKDAFTIYFFQDDFFALSISKIYHVSDILMFFIPRSDVQFYRPLSVQFYYFVSRTLFSLNPIGFHIIAFFFFTLNVILVYLISSHFLSSKTLAYVSAFLYSTSSIHNDSLFWIANFSYILVNFFFLSAFLLLILKQSVPKTLIIPMFILGLFSSEYMIVFPVVVTLYTFLFKDLNKNMIKIIFVLIIISFIYLYIRFIFFSPSVNGYGFHIDRHLLSSLRWYFLFFINWAETMKDQMVNFYTIRSDFLHTFSLYVFLFILNLVVWFFIFFIMPAFFLLRRKEIASFWNSRKDVFLFFLLWTIISITPIIFIPSQMSPHRGSLSFIGFLLIFFIPFDFVLTKSYSLKKVMYLSLFMISFTWLMATVATLDLNKNIHWVYRRSTLAKQWIENSKNQYPMVEKGDTIVINSGSNEVKLSLDNGQALREVYNDDSIRVVFSTNSANYKNAKTVYLQ